MRDKFSQYLFNYQVDWSVYYKGIKYNAKLIENILLSNVICWKNNNISFDKNKFIIGIGYDQIDYFLYVSLASFLGLKIILCDPRMVDTLLKNYNLSYQYIISTKKINTHGTKALHLSLNNNIMNINRVSIELIDQAKIIFFTSGTTNIPKLVQYSEDILLKNATAVNKSLNIKEKSSCLIYFPTNYMYGFSMLVTTLLNSGTIYLERPTITANEIWEIICKNQISVLPINNKIIKDMSTLIANNNIYFNNLTILNASDKIFSATVKMILKICPVFFNNFGQTESGPRIFSLKITKNNLMNISKYSYNGIVALGKTIDPKIKISIRSLATHKECQLNEIGELIYDSPYAMDGYIMKDGSIVKLDEIYSGDLVFKNENDCIFWVGRKTEAAKINGKFVNISILHIAFIDLEFIVKCYFTIDEYSNEISGYFVVKQDISEHMYFEVKKLIQNKYRIQFPLYPRLKKIIFIDDIPTTLTGKINISQLKKITLKAE
jgi:acyl-coenzyme A synthetase/AMP-(fatty) acid ligase